MNIFKEKIGTTDLQTIVEIDHFHSVKRNVSKVMIFLSKCSMRFPHQLSSFYSPNNFEKRLGSEIEIGNELK